MPFYRMSFPNGEPINHLLEAVDHEQMPESERPELLEFLSEKFCDLTASVVKLEPGTFHDLTPEDTSYKILHEIDIAHDNNSAQYRRFPLVEFAEEAVTQSEIGIDASQPPLAFSDSARRVDMPGDSPLVMVSGRHYEEEEIRAFEIIFHSELDIDWTQ